MEAYAQKLVIVALVLAIATGHKPTVAMGQTLCGMTTDGLMACRSSVSGANPPPPSATCCTALSGADMQCLCKYKKSNLLASFGIDPSLAMQLPAKCNLAQAFPCA
ncbi:hypothetical protein RHSIM_Rhsim05G0076600 [Rhododendron simsii]|uniref:Bifunctional inhibitor/plant lipid transfer protein/seed storage helical domain-containing protein n=1 Tax=Rhododendron simsii TaxID=118357 RepID=A0A834GVX1_RHOSS|nr:hypothetical protein RHSIM_Rhsim05G0076600 [Rhododendron simsii]